jgi:hypothetical protein
MVHPIALRGIKIGNLLPVENPSRTLVHHRSEMPISMTLIRRFAVFKKLHDLARIDDSVLHQSSEQSLFLRAAGPISGSPFGCGVMGAISACNIPAMRQGG